MNNSTPNTIFGRHITICTQETLRDMLKNKAESRVRPPLNLRGGLTAVLYSTFVVISKDNLPFVVEHQIDNTTWHKTTLSTSNQDALLFLSYLQELYNKVK